MLPSIKFSNIKLPALSKVLVTSFLLVFTPIFIGLTTALMGVSAVLFWGILLAPLLLLIIFKNSRVDYSGKIFIVCFWLYFLFPFFHKITGFPFTSVWQLCIFFGLFGIKRFAGFLQQANLAKMGMFILGGFLSLALLFSFIGRSHFLAALYQFISDLKPLLMVMAGFAVTWNEKIEKWFWKFFDWYWLPAMLLIAFEWVLPTAYAKVFYVDLQSIEHLYAPTRAVGPFKHSSYFAASGAMFALAIFARMMVEDHVRKFDWVRLAIYVGVVISTVQRTELMALLLSLLFVYIIAQPKKVLARTLVAFVMLLMGGAAFWAVFGHKLEFEIAQMGVGTVGSIENARVQIIQSAYDIAKEWFPVGSGLGTYGGAGADKFDHSLYVEMGFHRYWWFGRENFLMDTYWPNSLAETGFIGALLLLLSYVFLFSQALRNCVNSASASRKYWCFASAGIFYLFFLSTASPSFQDPILAIFPLVVFGLAHHLDHRANSAHSLGAIF